MAQWVQVTRLEVVDQLAYLQTPAGVLMVWVLRGTEALQVRERVLAVRHPDQIVVVTWTGLIQVTPVSQQQYFLRPSLLCGLVGESVAVCGVGYHGSLGTRGVLLALALLRCCN